MRRISGLLLLAAAACSQGKANGGPQLDPPETHERFVGEWMIDQPLHATYEATWYFYHDDGTLEHLRDCSLGGPVPTGFVADVNETVRCEFANGWSAPDGDTLIVAGACTDSRDREIVLGFPTDTSGNASGLPAGEIQIVAVDGEDGWLHAPFDWRWVKCGDQSCEPAISDLECP